MKCKLAIPLAVAAIIAGGIVFFSVRSQREPLVASSLRHTSSAGAKVPESGVKASAAASTRGPITKHDPGYAAVYASAVPWRKFNYANYAWRERHGYALGLYANYDDATLKSLAASGDPLAQTAWFLRQNTPIKATLSPTTFALLVKPAIE
ncbi:MAG: hypothetical protein ACYDB9_12630, partial [Gammaproteobacteria bacterium]